MSLPFDRGELRHHRQRLGITQQEVAEGLARLAWAHEAKAVGVNADMVSKWERGEKQPSRFYRRFIGLLFGTGMAEVGLGLQSSPVADARAGALPGSSVICHLDRDVVLLLPALTEMWEDLILKRRSLLKLLGVVPLSALGEISEGVALRGLADPARPTADTVTGLEALAAKYLRLYQSTDPLELLTPVLAHVRTVSSLLSEHPPLSLRTRLLANYGCVALLAGRLTFFDLRDSAAARGFFTIALDAARESDDRVLAAAALGHASFVPASERNYGAASAYLRGANASAALADVPIVRSWLGAVEAEISTQAGSRVAAFTALEHADDEIQQSGNPAPTWFDFYDGTRLHGFRGYSELIFGHLEAARGSLEHAVAALPEQAGKQRAVVLADLADVHLRSRDLDEACRVAGTAAGVLQRAGYATGTDRLRQFRRHVEPWRQHRAVRMLDEQLSTM